jgi:hypothetical protein
MTINGQTCRARVRRKEREMSDDKKEYTTDELEFIDRAIIATAGGCMADPSVKTVRDLGLREMAMHLLEVRREIRGSAKVFGEKSACALGNAQPTTKPREFDGDIVERLSALSWHGQNEALMPIGAILPDWQKAHEDAKNVHRAGVKAILSTLCKMVPELPIADAIRASWLGYEPIADGASPNALRVERMLRARLGPVLAAKEAELARQARHIEDLGRQVTDLNALVHEFEHAADVTEASLLPTDEQLAQAACEVMNATYLAKENAEHENWPTPAAILKHMGTISEIDSSSFRGYLGARMYVRGAQGMRTAAAAIIAKKNLAIATLERELAEHRKADGVLGMASAIMLNVGAKFTPPVDVPLGPHEERVAWLVRTVGEQQERIMALESERVESWALLIANKHDLPFPNGEIPPGRIARNVRSLIGQIETQGANLRECREHTPKIAKERDDATQLLARRDQHISNIEKVFDVLHETIGREPKTLDYVELCDEVKARLSQAQGNPWMLVSTMLLNVGAQFTPALSMLPGTTPEDVAAQVRLIGDSIAALETKLGETTAELATVVPLAERRGDALKRLFTVLEYETGNHDKEGDVRAAESEIRRLWRHTRDCAEAQRKYASESNRTNLYREFEMALRDALHVPHDGIDFPVELDNLLLVAKKRAEEHEEAIATIQRLEIGVRDVEAELLRIEKLAESALGGSAIPPESDCSVARANVESLVTRLKLYAPKFSEWTDIADTLSEVWPTGVPFGKNSHTLSGKIHDMVDVLGKKAKEQTAEVLRRVRANVLVAFDSADDPGSFDDIVAKIIDDALATFGDDQIWCEHIIEFRSGTYFRSLDDDMGCSKESARRFTTRAEAEAFLDAHQALMRNGAMVVSMERPPRAASEANATECRHEWILSKTAHNWVECAKCRAAKPAETRT